MAKITIKQHYVWQYYLKAWECDKVIWCLSQSDAKLFKTKTSSVACKRFFYQSSHLIQKDIDLIKQFINSCQSPTLREMHEFLFNIYAVPTMLSNHNENRNDPNLREFSEDLRRTTFEDYHGSIEQDALPILDSLRREDASILQSDEKFSFFCNYIIHQMFRTPRLSAIANQLDNDFADTLNRNWPLFGAMLSINIAFSLFFEREMYKIQFLRHKGHSTFITSDQPVFNLTHQMIVI